ncbi:MAG: HNH endonuclease [Alkalinema sp. RU_4_3]|nr:HNH endonuclease [Alkalinema sp. RU_4_3]
MHSKYTIVATRANRACEYCDAPETISNVAFEVDHTTPISKGGSDDFDNLALACRICNLRKSDHTDALDPLTQTVVPLFNPRQHNWSEHFGKSLQSPYQIIGKTPIGRATVLRLDLNSSLQLRAREFWVALGIFSLD